MMSAARRGATSPDGPSGENDDLTIATMTTSAPVRSVCAGQQPAVSGRVLGILIPPEIPVAEDPLEPMLTKRGVALYLDVSERTVDRLVETGALRCFRIGGHRRFRLDNVERYVASCAEGGGGRR
jgi:excisionase family DNA binding protein